ncbi:hypothetical protein ACMFMF_008479 [Clarireedia jacksonii]
MKFASKSAMESDNSAKAGSKASRGALDRPSEAFFAESWREDLDEGRSGVVGRERGRRGADVDRFVLLPLARGVVEAIILFRIAIDIRFGACFDVKQPNPTKYNKVDGVGL